MKASPHQQAAFNKAAAWLRIRYAPFFYLAGYAGTGKSTLASLLSEHVDGEVMYGAFTGKAAKVMRSKGCTGAQTIHSMIYEIVEDAQGNKFWRLRRSLDSNPRLIIIDECSMVNEEMGQDLLSFGKPILVLGDPAQLPPVSGGGFFTKKEPDAMLTEIHRQATDSPILRIATEIREGRYRPRAEESAGLYVTRRDDLDPAAVHEAGTVIVGKNKTRQAFNRRLREIRGHAGPRPRQGETLICLRNDRERGISNGETFEIISPVRAYRSKQSKNRMLGFEILDRDDAGALPKRVTVREEFFTDPGNTKPILDGAMLGSQAFDYGYCITCHKSQGSQWSNVCVFDESRTFREDRDRWLYTAVTRAADHLTLVI